MENNKFIVQHCELDQDVMYADSFSIVSGYLMFKSPIGWLSLRREYDYPRYDYSSYLHFGITRIMSLGGRELARYDNEHSELLTVKIDYKRMVEEGINFQLTKPLIHYNDRVVEHDNIVINEVGVKRKAILIKFNLDLANRNCFPEDPDPHIEKMAYGEETTLMEKLDKVARVWTQCLLDSDDRDPVITMQIRYLPDDLQ